VKLIVFDMDETLTLVSYMIEENDSPEIKAELVAVNFETPWVEGSRLRKLRSMLKELQVAKDGSKRLLAVLSRNSGGAVAVLKLLQEARLADAFTAIWTLPLRQSYNGAAQNADGEWSFFRRPLVGIPDHKVDVLFEVTNNPTGWLPSSAVAEAFGDTPIGLENVVLVDDQRANFQSPYSGRQIFRYCKVARYDAMYRNFGWTKNMGGLGARSAADYETLVSFVDDPSSCKETLAIRCVQRPLPAVLQRCPVKLVVFDFDETLTLATFFPEDDQRFAHTLDWDPASLEDGGSWNRTDLLDYNFESPFASGSRLDKLRTMFERILREGLEGDERRVLAILSKNEKGAISVLNLLRVAELDHFFSAIWTMQPPSATCPSARVSGLFRNEASGVWSIFSPPQAEQLDHKATILRHIVEQPSSWFPQVAGSDQDSSHKSLRQALSGLSDEGIVLVDDERANFRNIGDTRTEVLRYCKVARYDELYRNCGPLNQMGGIGAHSDDDYDQLLTFIRAPWTYGQLEEEEAPTDLGTCSTQTSMSEANTQPSKHLPKRFSFSSLSPASLLREKTQDEDTKALRARRVKSLSNPELCSLAKGACLKRVATSPATTLLCQYLDGELSPQFELNGLPNFDIESLPVLTADYGTDSHEKVERTDSVRKAL